MNGGHKSRAKSVWESRFSEILDLPPWRKNPFKVGSSKGEKFQNAQNGIKKNSKSQKLAEKLDSQNLIHLR